METLQQVLTVFHAQSMEASQHMMYTFQVQSATNMDMLLRQQADMINQIVNNVAKKPMTDTRGIGKPETFKGDENNYIEWKTKLLAFSMLPTRMHRSGWSGHCPRPLQSQNSCQRMSTNQRTN